MQCALYNKIKAEDIATGKLVALKSHRVTIDTAGATINHRIVIDTAYCSSFDIAVIDIAYCRGCYCSSLHSGY